MVEQKKEENCYDMPLGEFVTLTRQIGEFSLFVKLKQVADKINETGIPLKGIENWKILREEQED